MGLFEQANGGTIFLDEIGDISLKLQARLLRVLQEKEIMRVGGSQIIPIDVRIIAATNKDLLKMIQENIFREDLYHRLKVLFIHLPELRARRNDIELLAKHFVALSDPKVKIEQELIEELQGYPWYGNVRELKNTIDYMLAVRTGNQITKMICLINIIFKSLHIGKQIATKPRVYRPFLQVQTLLIKNPFSSLPSS